MAANKGTFCHEPTTLAAIMEISPLFLARFQFSLSLSFHVLFAATAMALGWLVFAFRTMAWRHPVGVWMDIYRFWVRIFALTFFMALASVIPLLLELGVLWPSLMERIGNVAGPLIAFGLTTLFVIKSVFLGVMFFGQRRVSPRVHVLSVAMVAIGMSATVFWGVVLISWTHTPAGTELIDGRYLVTDWYALIFHPGLFWSIAQFVGGSFLIGSALLLSVTAWQAGRRPLLNDERAVYRIGVILAFVAASVQLVALDGHLRLLARTQPVTAAAVMGVMQTTPQPDFVWLGWPAVEDKAPTGLVITDWSARRWLSQQADLNWIGVDQAGQDVPRVNALFWLARLAAYTLIWFVGLSVVALWIMLRRGTDPAKYPPKLLQFQAWCAGLSIFVWLCIWNLNELARMPFMVWNTIRQEDVLTASSARWLAIGLVISILIYGVLLNGWIRMLTHAARYGVVPVRKPGVRL